MSAADDLDEAAPKAKPAAKVAKAPAKSAKAGVKPGAGSVAKAVVKSGAKAGAKPEARPAKAETKAATRRGTKSPGAESKSGTKAGGQPRKSAASAKAGAAPEAPLGAGVVVEARAAPAVVIETALAAKAARPETAADTWDAAARDSLRWTSTVMAIVPLFLLVFNAASLKNWADQLAPSPTTVVIKNAADGWEATTRTLGLSAPRDALHNAWNKAVALKWDGTSGDGADPG